MTCVPNEGFSMQAIFEKAEAAFEQEDYRTARLLYGQCASQVTTGVTPEQRNSAIFMITVLYLAEYNFEQARLYAKLFDQSLEAPFLPDVLKGYALEDYLQSAPLEIIPLEATEVDFTGMLQSGNYFQKVLSTLAQKPNLNTFLLGQNPLTETEVHAFLDFLHTRLFVQKVDLSGLPFGKLALFKLKKLLLKIERENPVMLEPIEILLPTLDEESRWAVNGYSAP